MSVGHMPREGFPRKFGGWVGRCLPLPLAGQYPKRCHAERSRSTPPTCVTYSASVRSLDVARDDIAILRARR